MPCPVDNSTVAINSAHKPVTAFLNTPSYQISVAVNRNHMLSIATGQEIF
jgi:hypothetical protein